MTKRANKVLLLGIDGLDWNLMSPLLDAGELPFIRQMVEGGTVGNLSTISPTLSPILWNSIATGKRAYETSPLAFGGPGRGMGSE